MFRQLLMASEANISFCHWHFYWPHTLGFWKYKHHVSGTKRGKKTPPTYNQSLVTVYRSFWTLMKETSPNLLGRDTALTIKYPETRDIRFCWHKWSSLPLKGRPRSFFFLFFLSNASYTSLRISGLYYKHTAVSFERNRRCSVFL